MTGHSKALLWAGIIITAAILLSGLDASKSASFGVITGLTGAAWGSLQSQSGCGRSCWQ